MKIERNQVKGRGMHLKDKLPRAGFTLIESVIVIIVLGLALVGLSTVVYQALQDTYTPEVISTATALAEKEAERIIRLDFGIVVNENRDIPQAYSGDFSSYRWQVRVDSIDAVQSNLVSVLGSDPTMTRYKVVEVRVHHNVIDYVSIKLLKVLH